LQVNKEYLWYLKKEVENRTIHLVQKFRIKFLQHVKSNHPKDIARVTTHSKNVALLAACFMLISCLVYSTLKMVTRASEMSVDFSRMTCHYIPEDRTLLDLQFVTKEKYNKAYKTD
jgi:hypothetical protein